MFKASSHKYLVPSKGKFKLSKTTTEPPKNKHSKSKCKALLESTIKEIHDLQRVLYAHDKHSILLLFQAMDAAGKDSTIRAVMSGVNPAGCQVHSFKQPSKEELDHDFLWRTTKKLPERGRIGIFNRSYYEETLVVRVHPEYLNYQKLPDKINPKTIWKERFESINDFEKHMARNGTVILKFWLNVSKEEQLKRFLARLDNPDKNWKFAMGDVEERKCWNQYMKAYEDVLDKTSKPWAPWYAIPADDKPYMRLTVAGIILDNLKKLGLAYPKMDTKLKNNIKNIRSELMKEV